MIYYMVRHKASGDFMPQLKRDRGYTHWNPSNGPYSTWKKLTGSPRLFHSLKKARQVIAQWNCMPNAKMGYTQGYDGMEEADIDIKPDGRKKEDLEVVMVEISICLNLPASAV